MAVSMAFSEGTSRRRGFERAGSDHVFARPESRLRKKKTMNISLSRAGVLDSNSGAECHFFVLGIHNVDMGQHRQVVAHEGSPFARPSPAYLHGVSSLEWCP